MVRLPQGRGWCWSPGPAWHAVSNVRKAQLIPGLSGTSCTSCRKRTAPAWAGKGRLSGRSPRSFSGPEPLSFPSEPETEGNIFLLAQRGRVSSMERHDLVLRAEGGRGLAAAHPAGGREPARAWEPRAASPWGRQGHLPELCPLGSRRLKRPPLGKWDTAWLGSKVQAGSRLLSTALCAEGCV